MKKLWILMSLILIGCLSCVAKPVYELPEAVGFRMGDKNQLTTLASGDMFLAEDVSDADTTKYTTMDDINTYIGNLYCLKSVFGISIGAGFLLDGTVLKTSAILQKYHGVDPAIDVLAMLGSDNDTALRAEIGLAIGTDVQAYEATLTDIADGTIAENLINEAHPWADNETANVLTLDWLQLSVLTSAPSSPVVNRLYIADNDTWDPCDIVSTTDYYCICTNATAPEYSAILKGDGSIPITSIELPSFTHFATGDATYTDTTTPHVLTSEETKNSIITNAGAAQDRVYTCPAAEFGMNFMVMVIAAYQMDVEPNGTETLWLNGTQMAAGEHIINAADTKGGVMSCWSVESGDGTYEIFCKSDNSNFAQATP